jgi:cytoskeletal protein RodZ
MGVFGNTLRQARAHKGVTLREAEVATRINRHWLLALEEEHFDQLPALIYQRGIVRNYATYLNLDPAKLLAMFSEARGDRPSDEPSVLAQPMTVAPAGSFVPNFAVIAFVVVAMGAMFAWGYSAYFAGANTAPDSGAVPTATQLSDEERFVATNTPVPPTNTPAVTAVPTKQATSASDSNRVQMKYPTVTTTPESISLDNGYSGNSDGQGDSNQIDQAPVNQNGDLSYSFYAVTDVDLLIVVDQVVVWQQPLVAGQATGYLTGSSFVVSISGADSIVVLDGSGTETTMSGPEFTLP